MPGDRTFHVVEAVMGDDDSHGATLRRRWSDDFKEQAVAAALEPGVNVSALARRMGISPAQLFGWRRQAVKGAAATKPSPSAVPEIASAPDISLPAVPLIEITLCGAVIRIGPDVGEADLIRVLRAVRRS